MTLLGKFTRVQVRWKDRDTDVPPDFYLTNDINSGIALGLGLRSFFYDELLAARGVGGEIAPDTLLEMFGRPPRFDSLLVQAFETEPGTAALKTLRDSAFALHANDVTI